MLVLCGAVDFGGRVAYNVPQPLGANLAVEEDMPATKTTKRTKKSKGLKRGKVLQAVKPLDKPVTPPTESLSLNLTKIGTE
jgi:hypothetical protein